MKKGINMGVPADEMLKTIKTLSDTEKLKLVDTLLEDLDKPDPEIDRIWAEEARHRYKIFQEGHLKATDYKNVMKRHRTQ
jgi:hypothetical protein